MSFLGNLFKSKTCAICYAKMGMTEQKELANGAFICNKCADKLSKWFTTDARKHSTPPDRSFRFFFPGEKAVHLNNSGIHFNLAPIHRRMHETVCDHGGFFIPHAFGNKSEELYISAHDESC